MKTRSFFVSNSSSSSFAIIGVSDDRIIRRIARAVGAEFECYDPNYEKNKDSKKYTRLPMGRTTIEDILFVGYNYFDPECAGLDAEEILKTMSIQQATTYFKQMMLEKYDIDIPLEAIFFQYGECTDGH